MTTNFISKCLPFIVPDKWVCKQRSIFFGICLIVISFPSFAQIVVKGKVTTEDGGTLPGVTISVKGTNVLVITDESGNYTIPVSNDAAILVFSYISMQRVERTVGTDRVINVTLHSDNKNLTEVVVIGYGTQSRDKITTSISKLDTKVLDNIPYTNAASALQGGIPGLMVQSTNGQPGSAPRIILRGGTSINNPNGSAPLYIIDGVIRSDMNDLSSDDIESMQVLKDAAATSIYGARASNGVVLITTKSGKEGSTRISFSHDYSIANEAVDIQHVSAADYVVGVRQSLMWTGVKNQGMLSRLDQATGYGTGNDLTNNTAYTTQYLTAANQHKLNEGWQSVQDPYDPTKTIIFQETNFQDLRRQTAISKNYHVSASGGSSKATYSASLGYLDGEGTALASDYRRLSYNINGSLQVTSNLKITGRTLYSYVDSHAQTNYYNTFTRSAALPSTTKFAFEDGTIAPGLNSSLGNPLYYQVGPYAPYRKTVTTKSTQALSAQWEIIPGLTLEPQASLYETTERFNYFQPMYLSGITTVDATRAATQNSRSNTNWQVGSVLSYVKKVGRHNFDTKIGYEYYDRNYWDVLANGRGAATDNIPTLNASAEPRTVSGSETRFVTEGVFSRINYDFDAKYLFSFNIRYDGASNLGANSRTGFFPGVSLGWNLHRESLWRKMLPTDLVQLKLRASYGENGNIQGLGDFQAQGIYSVDAKYNGESAIQPSVIPNENLSWEKSRTFDVGFDLGLFKRRINLVFDYYDRLTSDLLTNVTLPTSSGYSSILTNNGSLRNRGIELGLDVGWLKPENALQWNTTFNFSKVSTRIVKLPYNGVDKNRQGGIYIYNPAVGAYVWAGGLQEGGRVGDIFALSFQGVYATDQEAASAPTNTFIRVNDKRSYGGDSKWLDLDGNGFIDNNDRYLVGNQFPTITGGFNNALSYKNLSLNIRTDFTLGHTIHNYANHFLDGQMQGDAMPRKVYYERSWKNQGDITNTPRYMYQDQQANLNENSDMFYEKGDFLAIREVSLVYSLPSKFAKKMKMSNLRLNLTGYNLHYFTSYSGLNPEDGGRDEGRYPNPRTFTMGIQASF